MISHGYNRLDSAVFMWVVAGKTSDPSYCPSTDSLFMTVMVPYPTHCLTIKAFLEPRGVGIVERRCQPTNLSDAQ